MELSEAYKRRIQELANINKLPKPEIKEFNEIIKSIIKRVPIFKNYNISVSEYHDLVKIILQKQKCFGEKKMATKDKVVSFDDYCVFSEVVFGYRHFNEHKWYYFNFKNELHPRINEKIETDKLFNTVFMSATKMIDDKFSISTEEFRIPEQESLSIETINSIVEKLNKTSLDFENYLLKHLKLQFF